VSAVHGAAALGVFNQVFAVYIVLSQLGALGIHYSALRHLAAENDPREQSAIATSALLLTVLVGAAFAGAGWLLAGPIGAVLDSARVATGVRYAAPGVLFFALSKVTLASVNALERMRWYAILSAGRFLLMILAFAGFTLLEVDPARLPVIITLAEGSLLLLSLVPIAGLLRRVPLAALGRWTREHLRFGVKGFSSGLVAELNTRIDVLILGAFAGDGVVGAYSFAAILAEGLYQLLVVLRTNFAPAVIRLWAEGRREELVATVRRVRDRTYLASAVGGALAVAGYALLVPLVTKDPLLADSWRYFAVLIGGMVASSGYAPFLPLLLYAGLPGWYTIFMVAILGANAIGNLALVPALGALGAATATAITFVASVLLLRAMAARLLALRI
jgi:O-antigen/teichoic acid export membrane protein